MLACASIADFLTAGVTANEHPQIHYHLEQSRNRASVDPEMKKVLIPGIAVIHKLPGEAKMTKFEVFLDRGPLKERVRELQEKEERRPK